MRSKKKQGKQRSRKTEKQNSKEADKQRSKEAGKRKKTEKQRSKKVGETIREPGLPSTNSGAYHQPNMKQYTKLRFAQ